MKIQLLRPHADPKNKPQHLTTRPVWQWQERQTHQNGDSSRTGGQILSTNIWEMSGSYTRFCLCFLGLLLLNLYIDCFFLSTQSCEQSCLWIESQVVSPTARWHPMLPVTVPATLVMEPLKLISSTCHGTFRTKPWNPSKPFATNSPKLSKNKAKTHISNLPWRNFRNTSGTFVPKTFQTPEPSKLYSPQPGLLTFQICIGTWDVWKLKTSTTSSPPFRLEPHPGLDVDHKAQEGTKEFTKHQVGLHRSQRTVGEGNCLALNRLAISG